MPLSWNEIRDRAFAFSREWAGEPSEKAEAKSFWDAFFPVFGITRRRVALFEEPAKRLDGTRGYIDLFWKGVLIVEHKSRGKDLTKAFGQAIDYLGKIPERDLPKYVLVSDFARFRLYNLETGEDHEFPLKELHKNIQRFGFIAGYQPLKIREEDPVNVVAAERMGRLHDQLKASGYTGHALEVYLVRLLFCLFADDTGIFEPRARFQEYLERRTGEDGADLGNHLAHLFQILNTPGEKRQTSLDEDLAGFPHVNGKLFEETLPLASFDSHMRVTLLDCAGLDWGRISPAVFGALFQSVMDVKLRRNLGAHYTSEKNILKVIKPLLLDDLRGEFEKAKNSERKLFDLLKKISNLRFLDPACGCGNFLVIAYRELRLLEFDVLLAMQKLKKTSALDFEIFTWVQVNVDQFYGIEIEEFPREIAQVAMWLTDHQMNMRVSVEFGQPFIRLPLKHSATIRHGNALRLDWNEVISAERVDYILGNPPFVGAKFLSDEQRKEIAAVFSGMRNAGLLDYVAAWYVKAALYVRGQDSAQAFLDGLAGAGSPPRDRVKIAFVSTNSIAQGEQVGALWSELLRLGVKIHFAHRTFRWSNEGRGMAAVHCVIVGFALFDTERKIIFEYADIAGEPHSLHASNINPYLVSAPDVLLRNRTTPICPVPRIGIGNKPIDDGNYLFTTEEREAFIALEPDAAKHFRRWIGSHEFINGYERWCLWLGDCFPNELRAMPAALKRVEAVKQFRLASKSASTRAIADKPTRFHVENFPTSAYLVLPEVSSERRPFIPMGFCEPDTLCSNLVKIAPSATRFHFGILSSTMHMAWVRYTCGRLKSDFRYSAGIVYNNFPWPREPSEKQVRAIEETGQGVLDARAKFPDDSLADLYHPIAMPPGLRQAHEKLDRAVDAAYGKKDFKSDAERVAFLFELYHQYTSLLPVKSNPKRRQRGARATQ